MTAYTVLATRLDQLLPDGSEVKYRAGDVVRDLSDADVKRHLASGNIGPVRDADEPVAYDDSGADPGDADLGDSGDDGASDPAEKPETDANKPKLVDYVVANLVHDDGTDYTKSEAAKLNKDELWALINSVEV